MVHFQDIIGHDDVVAHLQNAIRSGKVSHSYLITGDAGVGKKLLANTFAAALQCEESQADPCMQCDSCKKAMGNNHPDIRIVEHEKPGLITIDEIRTQVVNDVDIRPYSGKYKIYIIPDAELMNVNAQNAVLKTIEEPPSYVVILLLTVNPDSLLPTILSRCVRLDLKPASDAIVRKYLMEHMHIADYQAEIDASLAHGSIGRAKQAASSEEFGEMVRRALQILRHADTMDTTRLVEIVKELTAGKDNLEDYLDLFQFWFRDVLMFKATREADHLVFKEELNDIRQQAEKRTYENIEKILSALDKTKVRIRAKVNTELALDLLFSVIKTNN